MTALSQTLPAERGASGSLATDLACLALGAAFTFVLFTGVAVFENVRPPAPQPEIEDLRIVASVFVPPPPKPVEETSEVESVVPLSGLEVGPSDSTVKVAVIPQDLSKILPIDELPPKATIQFGQVMAELKPKMGFGADIEHIYQASEVDVKANAIVRTNPKIPSRIREDIDEVHVVLLVVIDADATLSSARVLRSSGNATLDKTVLECVRDEWEWSAAIRKGHKVRQLVQVPVWIKWSAASKFSI